MLDELRTGVAAGEAERLSRAAHAFKGMAANFTDGAVVAAAQALEHTARAGRLEEAPALLERIERELADLLGILRPLAEVQPCES
jgi:HPt (histidine-containing phosphotransfer) domain-containing protein